jgi:hypothetical protein
MIHVCIDGSGMRTEFSFSRVEIQTWYNDFIKKHEVISVIWFNKKPELY